MPKRNAALVSLCLAGGLLLPPWADLAANLHLQPQPLTTALAATLADYHRAEEYDLYTITAWGFAPYLVPAIFSFLQRRSPAMPYLVLTALVGVACLHGFGLYGFLLGIPEGEAEFPVPLYGFLSLVCIVLLVAILALGSCLARCLQKSA